MSNPKPSVSHPCDFNKACQLIKAKIGYDLAKLAYNEVAYWQKQGRTIDLTMWYVLVNYKENPSWNPKAIGKNYKNGVLVSYDMGLGQVNTGVPRMQMQLLNPHHNIKRSIAILAEKNIYKDVKGSKWHTFKRYNGIGADAEEYARICWRHYKKLKGA